MNKIEELCKRKGIEFVPHTDPRVKKFKTKLRRRSKYKFFYNIKCSIILHYLDIKDLFKNF